jgi:hypothetical protein
MKNNYQLALEFQNFCAKRAYEKIHVESPFDLKISVSPYIIIYDRIVECRFYEISSHIREELWHEIELSIEELNLSDDEWSVLLQTKKDLLDTGKKNRQQELDQSIIESNIATIQRLQKEIDEILLK